MKERHYFFYCASIAALLLCFLRAGADSGGAASGLSVAMRTVVLLACCVLFSGALLLAIVRAPRFLAPVLHALACAGLLWYAPRAALPAVCVAVAVLAHASCGIAWLGALMSVLCAIVAVLAGAGALDVTLATLFAAALLYALHLLAQRAEAQHALAQLGERAEGLRRRMDSRDRMARSMEHVSKLEERNRLATRIHDEIGHGMSGSILLLQGADAVLDREPARARETIRRVAENLRDSVDEIRKVLREERPVGTEMNLARIEGELASFEAGHAGMRTALEVDGRLDEVGQAVWLCVYENMLEAMTNTLKHSDSTLFSVRILSRERLLRVEFADDGGRAPAPAGEVIRRGGGLLGMEERAGLCYGRCFFHRREDGFHIVMTFPIKGSHE